MACIKPKPSVHPKFVSGLLHLQLSQTVEDTNSPGVIIWGPDTNEMASDGAVSVEPSVSWVLFSPQTGLLDKEVAAGRAWDSVEGFKMTLWAVARAPGKWVRRARFCSKY